MVRPSRRWYGWSVATYFDVCGTPALGEVTAMMRERGYRETSGRPAQPGEYRYDRTDAATGWSDWMYEVEVIELAEAPVAEVLARYAALNRR